MKVKIPHKQTINGDILFRFRHKGSVKNSLICRVSLNTSFLSEPLLRLDIRQLDPCSIKKDKTIDKDIMVDFYTDPYCLKCTNQTKLHKLCPRCRKELEYEIPKWQEISQIIHDHKCHNENELNTFMAQ